LLLALSPQELRTIDSRVDESLRVNVDKRKVWENYVAGLEPDTAVSAQAQTDWLWPFVWQGNLSIFTAMIKAVEDRLNVKEDTSSSDVPVIILVEDNVKFYSLFLPMLYAELMKHMKKLAADTNNPMDEATRLHSRPKVILATNFDEALDIFDSYQNNVIGVISDLGFCRQGVHNDKAGLELLNIVTDTMPHLPVLIQSSNPDIESVAKVIGCDYVNKNSRNLLNSVRKFLKDSLFFGDFQVKGADGQPLTKDGKPVVAPDKNSLIGLIRTMPDDSLLYHAKRLDFSKWFMARAETALAKDFRTKHWRDYTHVGEMREDMLQFIRKDRNVRYAGVVEHGSHDADATIVRIGKGSMGGKGRGFRFLNSMFYKCSLPTLVPTVEMAVPRSLILSTEVFDSFVQENELYELLDDGRDESDEAISAAFQAASLPADVVAMLSEHLNEVEDQTHLEGKGMLAGVPLAVRSSSMYEDAFQEPFAGVYRSYMLANDATASSLEERVAQLESAVKMVMASTYWKDARQYADATQHISEEEKMAVIVQEVCGSVREGDNGSRHFYPTMSGVINALDFYPLPDTTPSDGCAQVALGMGNAVVDGMATTRFSLAVSNNDTSSFASNRSSTIIMTAAGGGGQGTAASTGEDSSLSAAAAVPSMHAVPPLFSAIDFSRAGPNWDENCDEEGSNLTLVDASDDQRALVAAALNGQLDPPLPLVPLLSFLSKMGSAGLACPVEMEFALELAPNTKVLTSGSTDGDGKSKATAGRHKLSVLQIRPMGAMQQDTTTKFNHLPSDQYACVVSKLALGHGQFEGIRDVVYVKPGSIDFDSIGGDGFAHSTQVPAEIAAIDRMLTESNRPYILVGPGRWGTKDPTCGIPVSPAQISGAHLIIETDIEGKTVPPSQGAHFFQNLLAFGIGYMHIGDPPNPAPVTTIDTGADRYVGGFGDEFDSRSISEDARDVSDSPPVPLTTHSLPLACH
jgi:hypothetical protein